MTPKVRLSSAFDFIGISALTGAALALLGRSWLDTVAESTLFSMFFGLLALAVGVFLAARVGQIAHLVLSNPQSKDLRTHQETTASLASISSVSATHPAPAAQADLQRAA
jgi:hypothetical protein